jgi:hypothetical protein
MRLHRAESEDPNEAAEEKRIERCVSEEEDLRAWDRLHQSSELGRREPPCLSPRPSRRFEINLVIHWKAADPDVGDANQSNENEERGPH